jgi:acetyl esterase/lipase
MELSKEVQQNILFSDMMGIDKASHVPVSKTRETISHIPPAPDPTPVAEVINTTIPDAGIPVRIYIPVGEGPFPVVSYYHGGGFVLMSIDAVDEICRSICSKSGSVVMSVGYRLAPEYPYPAGPQDCIAATRWMISQAGDYKGIGDRMAVAGDSAGGYMALWVAQQLHAKGIELKAQFGAYPVTDHYTGNHASWEENKKGYGLTAEVMKWFWDSFLTDPSKFNEASPLRSADFTGLPPALIITCQYDPLRDEGKAYADKLQAAGVETVYKNYENVHGFLGIGEMGQQAMQTACDFLKEKLSSF